MTGHFRVLAAAAALLMASSGTEAFAQKHGGTLKIYDWDNPPSLSIHEEVTHATLVPMMGVLNNLIMYKQDEPQNSLESIVPDLATEWSWNEGGSHLTFRLREGVKWHDGRPFTAKDVQCTWDLLLGRSSERLRTNPHKAWYQNVEEVTADSDFVATFRLRRPQPALIALLASGFSLYIRATFRRVRCVSIRSAPAHSNSSNSSRRNPSRWCETRITGRKSGPTLTGSNIQSLQTARRRSLRLSPASWT